MGDDAHTFTLEAISDGPCKFEQPPTKAKEQTQATIHSNSEEDCMDMVSASKHSQKKRRKRRGKNSKNSGPAPGAMFVRNKIRKMFPNVDPRTLTIS